EFGVHAPAQGALCRRCLCCRLALGGTVAGYPRPRSQAATEFVEAFSQARESMTMTIVVAAASARDVDWRLGMRPRRHRLLEDLDGDPVRLVAETDAGAGRGGVSHHVGQ